MKDNSTHNSHIHAWKKPTCVGEKICLASGKYTWKIECCGYKLVLAESWRKKKSNNMNILLIIVLHILNFLIHFFLICVCVCAYHGHFLSGILKLEQNWVAKGISWYYLLLCCWSTRLCCAEAACGALVCCEPGWMAMLHSPAGCADTEPAAGWSKLLWGKKRRERHLSLTAHLRSI